MLAASHIHRHAARRGVETRHRRTEDALCRSPPRSNTTAVRVVHRAPLARLSAVAVLIARVARRTHAHERGANRRVSPLRIRAASHIVAVRVVHVFPLSVHAAGAGRLSELAGAAGTRNRETRESGLPHAFLGTVDLLCGVNAIPRAYGTPSSWPRARCHRSSSGA